MSSTECPSGFQDISGFCFTMGTEKKTFEEATAACQQLGGFLAEPRSEEISNAIKSFAPKHNYFFIGLKDIANNNNNNRTFLWQTDNAALSYEDWENGQPNNHGGQQHCVKINIVANNYGWDDVECTEERHYLCQANKSK